MLGFVKFFFFASFVIVILLYSIVMWLKTIQYNAIHKFVRVYWTTLKVPAAPSPCLHFQACITHGKIIITPWWQLQSLDKCVCKVSFTWELWHKLLTFRYENMLSKMWSGTQFKSVRSLSLKRFEETIIISSLKMRTYLRDNFPKFVLQCWLLQ